jgi:hypothetical protein
MRGSREGIARAGLVGSVGRQSQAHWGPATMLEEAERQVTELEAALQGPRPKSKIAVPDRRGDLS